MRRVASQLGLRNPRELLAGQAGHLLALRLSQYGILFLASILITRSLGPELRAQYSLVYALGSLVWAAVNLSIDQAASRFMARREADIEDVSRSLATAALVLGVSGGAVAVAVGFALQDSLLAGATTTAVVLAGLIVGLTMWQQVSVGLILRLGALREFGWIMATTSLIQLGVVIVLVVALTLTPTLALIAAVIGLAFRAIGLSVVVRRYVGGRALVPTGRMGLTLALMRVGSLVHGATLSVTLSIRVDLFLVSLLATTTEVGLYSLSATLAEFLFLTINTLSQSALKHRLTLVSTRPESTQSISSDEPCP